jgi:hypothetical protein
LPGQVAGAEAAECHFKRGVGVSKEVAGGIDGDRGCGFEGIAVDTGADVGLNCAETRHLFL